MGGASFYFRPAPGLPEEEEIRGWDGDSTAESGEDVEAPTDRSEASKTRDASFEKPQRSYIQLIAEAINSVPEKRLVLSDIYRYIRKMYPYFRNANVGWQVSEGNKICGWASYLCDRTQFAIISVCTRLSARFHGPHEMGEKGCTGRSTRLTLIC